MLRQWESADKSISKNVLKPGIFTKKPTECSTCNVFVENISVSGSSGHALKEKYYTNILDGEREKMLVIGEASAEIDRKVERAIQVMNTLEKSLVTITMPSQSEVKSETISVMFEITLMKCERHKPIWKWSPEEKYQVALKYKEIGIELFKSSRCVDAFYKFSKACKILITLEPMSELEDKLLQSNIENLRLTLYNNMASCQLNQKNFEHTVALCTKILNVDKENIKAFYRRGIAYGSMKDNEKAVADLKVALTLEPNNHTVKEQFHIYNTRLQEASQKCNDMVRKMFQL
ncbi:PREDICTED: 70 kDa peptidyl-prolyl isomerase [Dinoponera quadriceps]|uniref:70 kDa peptidyl-prolyl isomerase n=1 Tax=Dinoponera quadriceps TaxID=609295 RepID=A0A6P3XQ95_DINQU|nr:PREDICTED: 70 kDa peptidyl-prolyl isomerase [Dinoponera quadriceps]